MIYINATFTHDNPTGLGVYTYELTREIMSKECAKNYTVFTTSKALKQSCPRRVRLVSTLTSPSRGFVGHFSRYLWEQSVLPLRSLTPKNRVVFSTVPEGMLIPCCKQIVTVHDILPLKYPEMTPKMKYHFYYNLPRLLKISSAIICVSESTRKEMVDYFRIADKPIYVIREGFDKNKYSPRQDHAVLFRYGIRSRYFLFVGDMRPHKNLLRALEAFARVRISNIQFVIGGKKDPRFFPAIERKVQQLGISDRVVFTGYIADEDLAPIYSGAEAFVFPSLYEGFGLPPLEAMACGCPVITSNAASLPEVCGDAAYYIDPLDTEGIARGMARILSDDELRNGLSAKGLDRSRLFSWERSAREHVAVFDEVLAQ